MTLSAGTRIGPYEIVGPLGAGGMGEVFRARDPRLGRDVAIKALPAAFAQDAERLARFEREAKLLASLNHPNVAGIHGVEEADGTRYLVLEFIDGETLEAHVKRGPLALDEALDVARQVAAGVEAAHEAGVVHRDLKPGNVMLTASGGVKVLDFGLAKAGTGRSGSSSDPSLTASPTLTHQGTEAGVILGTAAYMSPEQARGKAVDRRTDIWSFGCVLYEMLSGRRAYDGETVSDMVARILEREPDWSALPAATPPRLAALLRRCMTKDAKQRQRDIGDVRLELEAIAAGGGEPAAGAGTSVTPARRGIPAWALATGALALVALGAAAAALRLSSGSDDQAATLTLLAPPGVSFGRAVTDMAISPDGKLVAFVASDTVAGRRLWVRGVDRENARPLEKTDNASYLFWAPDSRRVGFFADGKLMTVNVVSGAVRTLADAPLPRGGAWGDGAILYQPRSLGPLWSIPPEGGEPSVAAGPDSVAGQVGVRYPQFLPDGRHFVASVLGKSENQVAIGVVGTRTLKPLFRTSGGGGATFAAPDWLISARDGAVKAQRFDLRSFKPKGPAVEVPGLRAISPDAFGSPIVSASVGGMLLQRAAADLPQRIAILDRAGHTIGEVSGPSGTYSRGGLSPDGRRFVFEFTPTGASDTQVWVADLVRGGMQPFSFDNQNYTPLFSPDGTEIALTREVNDSKQDLWIMRADAPGSMRLLRHMETLFNSSLSFAPNGKGLLMRSQGTDTRQDLIFVSWGDGDSARVRPILATRFNEPVAAISPDGRWLAYVSDESGHYECSVRAFPSAEGQVAVVSRGAFAEPTASTRIGLPVWRRDGRELLYVAADGHTLMVVPVTPGDPPSFGPPQALFRLPNSVADIAVSPGLDRFVLSITREEEGRSAATILLHWPQLLENAK